MTADHTGRKKHKRARHHYVPQFLLRQWGPEGRLTAFYWEDRAQLPIVNTKATVGAACQVKGLNTLLGVPEELMDAPETHHFTPKIDTPASDALQVLLTKGAEALTGQQRADWARFLIAFAVRTPEALRDMGAKEAIKGLAAAQQMAKGPPEIEALVSAEIERNKAVLLRNMPLRIAMQLSADPVLQWEVGRMHWWVRTWDKNALLIGDRPLIAYPRAAYPCGIALDHPNCLVLLPIAPNKLFLAASNKATKTKARNLGLSRLAHIVNEETIYRSNTILAADRALERFVTDRLKLKAVGAFDP